MRWAEQRLAERHVGQKQSFADWLQAEGGPRGGGAESLNNESGDCRSKTSIGWKDVRIGGIAVWVGFGGRSLLSQMSLTWRAARITGERAPVREEERRDWLKGASLRRAENRP